MEAISKRRMLLLITSAALLVRQAQSACYWPLSSDADTTSGLKECKGLSGLATCCVGDDACLSNGMCLSGQGFLYQGGCITPNWTSTTAGCFAKCETTAGLTFHPISPCDGAKLCCGWSGETDPSDCCSNSGEGFTFDGATFAGPVQAPLFSDIVESVKMSYAGATVTKTVSNSGNSATGVAQCSADGYVKNSTAIGVGVGLGIALVLALAAVAWLSVKVKRNSTNYSHTHERSYREALQQSPLISNAEPKFEIQGNGRSELPSQVSELSSNYPRSPACDNL